MTAETIVSIAAALIRFKAGYAPEEYFTFIATDVQKFSSLLIPDFVYQYWGLMTRIQNS